MKPPRNHAEYLRARTISKGPAVLAGLDQVDAVIRDALDEAGITDDSDFDAHAVIVINLLFELSRIGRHEYPTWADAIRASACTLGIVFAGRTAER